MTEASFHARANAVRAESRLLMQKLRAERLAVSRHRPAARKPEPVAAASSPPPPPQRAKTDAILPSRKIRAAAPAQTPAVAAAVEAAAPAIETPAPVAAERETPKPKTTKHKTTKPKTAKPKARPPVEAAPAAVEPAAPLSETPKAAAKPKAASRTAGAKPSRNETTAPAAEPSAAMPETASVAPEADDAPVAPPAALADNPAPLGVLPTLGPGMIWRLNQIGLATVGDLAAMPADALRERLGAVAKLIRVENLIEIAQSHGKMRGVR